MKWRLRHLVVLVLVFVSVILSFALWSSSHEKVLRIGVYAGSSWDVPNSRENKALDTLIKKFEKTHPHVKIIYESGIPKKNYADWLAEQVLKGEQPDLFMVPENDFSMLASAGALKSLDTLLTDDERTAFYPVAYEAGQYQGVSYALPVESNPIMMCVNKDLLEKEGISIPESGWTLADFYEICKKVTKDTNGDGVVDQYGITDYTWQQALIAYGGHLTDKSGINVDSPEMHQALAFMSKLDMLSQHYKVTSHDFDEGRVAFYPMSLAQYRTYKPYPYHVAKYSSFSWTCIPMPTANSKVMGTQVKTSLFGMSSNTKQEKLAWEFMLLLSQDKESQQTLFEKSQGTSVLPSVVKSQQTRKILQADDFGLDSLTSERLDSMMERSIIDIGQEVDRQTLERLDYLIKEALGNQEIDSALPSIQKEIESR
ncbi:ABC transporter substrate-binding protein [Streptococcus cristatus]|uniref:ABC transporter, solute-binding protein n=3 Tax=Streptococcus cristatus TaxID=45634 RepID=A0AAV3EG57_STRCR|nr:extracellular solute-binding protein [Streptococcus cristatus]EFX52253.1 ABC transporter, solute-binding protein [Streptococcus cristatus ATCC 51100]EGU68524.1 ABC transporter, solute-binding protein [Streptococcus cristatus ATCC 51100]KJQ60590.1 extracellular solute-binding lipoprotein [Streptococcus cristatus]MCG7329574.1 extracellular solute-binding protein [Streptococcus cristatus]MCY7220826.1 extracellular solute-binding protein [Streptococcus cristatus]